MGTFNPVEFVSKLNKDGKLTPDDVKFLTEKLGIPEVAAVVKESVMLRSDYSRVLNEQQQQQATRLAELDRKQKELDTLGTSMNSWRDGEAKKRQTLERQIAALTTEVSTAAAKSKELADTYGIPEEDIYIPSTTITASNNNPASHQGGNGSGNANPSYVSKEEVAELINNALLQGMTPLIKMPHVYAQMATEHKALFGEDLKDFDAIVAKSAASQRTDNPLSITKIWEEQYGVPAKRDEVKEAGIQARIQKEVDEKLKAALSERGLPSARPALPISPVLNREVATIKPESQGVGLQSALAAWNTGKYAAKP